MPKAFLINGKKAETIPADDRGLTYGDGVFETIRLYRSKLELLDLHLDRLQEACTRLAIELDLALVRDDITTIIRSEAELRECPDNRAQVLRIIVSRGSGGRGYRPTVGRPANRILSMSLAPDYGAERERGVALRLCQQRLGLNPSLAGIKHLCRLENVLARAEWDNPEIFEGLMLDTAGHVIEGTMSNLFWLKGSKLYTPSIKNSGVAGVVREFIIEDLARRLQLTVHCGEFQPEQLFSADEVFITNSLMPLLPVVAVEGQSMSVGKITRRLQAELDLLLYA